MNDRRKIMTRSSRATLLLVMGLVWAATLAEGGAKPIQLSCLPADTTWLLHLDVDQLQRSQVGAPFLESLAGSAARPQMAFLQALLNFDPRTGLHSATLYGAGSSPSNAVLLLAGDFDRARLSALVKLGRGYQGSPHRSHTVHSWRDDSGSAPPGDRTRRFGAIHPSGLVVLGQKAERIVQALDVLDRLAPNLSRVDALPRPDAQAPSPMIFATARQTDLSWMAPNAALLKRCRSLLLTAGETNHQVRAQLVIQAENEGQARSMLAVSRGLLAWAALGPEQPVLSQLAPRLILTQQEDRVLASLEVSSTETKAWLEQAGLLSPPRREAR